jgi:hypothetical protein
LVDQSLWKILILLLLAAALHAQAVDGVESPYFVLVPYALGVTAIERGQPPVQEYKGEQVVMQYSVTFSGVEVLIRIPPKILLLRRWKWCLRFRLQ